MQNLEIKQYLWAHIIITVTNTSFLSFIIAICMLCSANASFVIRPIYKSQRKTNCIMSMIEGKIYVSINTHRRPSNLKHHTQIVYGAEKKR
jgi:hypothetical protein